MKIIITNIPAFYKINLFNEINKREPLLVIFCAPSSSQRNIDFYKGKSDFKSIFLSNNALKDIPALVKVIIQNNYDEFIIGGWDNPLFLLSSIISPKSKNAVIVESSDYESRVNGLKGLIKRLFLCRVSKAYCSGTPHERLVRRLGFRGVAIKTLGVGLPNIPVRPDCDLRTEVKNFLYVGRLSEEKNLKYVIRTFNRHPELNLHICGYGYQEEELKRIAGQNTIFHGAIDNEDLSMYYQIYDVLILMSISETWGLVVEEALMNNMPVLVSNMVGCREDIVKNDKYGLVIDLAKNDFEEKLKEICDVERYNNIRREIQHIDFKRRMSYQVECYI